jgi:hypothetical protein
MTRSLIESGFLSGAISDIGLPRNTSITNGYRTADKLYLHLHHTKPAHFWAGLSMSALPL